MALSQEEALIRIALLVTRADGHSRPAEMHAAMQALPALYQDLSEPQLEALMAAAEKELADKPELEVMERVLEALPDHAARVSALKVACLVADADQMLSWQETSYLSRLAAQLDLSRRDVSKVVRAAR